MPDKILGPNFRWSNLIKHVKALFFKARFYLIIF